MIDAKIACSLKQGKNEGSRDVCVCVLKRFILSLSLEGRAGVQSLARIIIIEGRSRATTALTAVRLVHVSLTHSQLRLRE